MKTLLIHKADESGWRVETVEKTYYVGECFSDGVSEGVVYKNSQAFNEQDNTVCYIPEYDFENHEQNASELFEFDAKRWAASDLENNPYVATSGYSYHDLRQLVIDWEGGELIDEIGEGDFYNLFIDYVTNLLFNCLSWQSPETLLYEWDVWDIWEDCPQLSFSDPRFKNEDY